MRNITKKMKCFYCGATLNPHGVFHPQCPACGKPAAVERVPDRKTQCGHCAERLEPEDRYCRICGTKVGEGAYAPYPFAILDLLEMQTVYGPEPPSSAEYKCDKCGHSWLSFETIEAKRFCPKCGSETMPSPVDEMGFFDVRSFSSIDDDDGFINISPSSSDDDENGGFSSFFADDLW